MIPTEVAARLAAVPVYTVADKNNQFVLVTGEGAEANQKMGIFFMAEQDAQALIDKLKKEHPKLGKQSQIWTLTLDKVYATFGVSAPEQTQDVCFRFLPDMRQVNHAMQLYKDVGVAANAFQGVPVFQAEGLTVNSDGGRQTPLFLSKEDLDKAIHAAFTQREAYRQEQTIAKHKRAEEELDIAKAKMDEAEGRRGKRQARQEVEKAEERLQKYAERLANLGGSKLPSVEIGCLEEVIASMEADKSGTWSNVMFVPPGVMADTSVPVPVGA